MFIADNASPLELDALKMALDELKRSTNTTLYKTLAKKVGDRLGPSYVLDEKWIESTDKKAASRLEKLESELNSYKTNLIKESIRMGHNDLGDFHYDRGDLSSALKCYLRTRDYCTTSKHIIQMCLNVIKVAIEMGNFAHVSNYVTKAQQTPDLSDATVIAKLNAAAALAQLEAHKYRNAARKFLECTFDLGSFKDVMSPADVALYAGLTALATFERAELKAKVLDNAQFRNFLELVPRVRELLGDFYNSRYGACLAALESFRAEMMLDIHLHDHVQTLFDAIRNKALTQYFSPYTAVDLNRMATAFNTNVSGLEKELARLIMDNSIQARIDSHKKVLHARTADARNTTFTRALALGQEYEETTRAMLLRVNLLRNDVMVRGPKGDAGDGRRPAAPPPPSGRR